MHHKTINSKNKSLFHPEKFHLKIHSVHLKKEKKKAGIIIHIKKEIIIWYNNNIAGVLKADILIFWGEINKKALDLFIFWEQISDIFVNKTKNKFVPQPQRPAYSLYMMAEDTDPTGVDW